MKILVTVPCAPPWLHKHVVFTLLALQRDPRVTVMLPTHRPFENNLHHIITNFVDGDYDYWLSFDADNPPIRNPLDLVALDKDILGCPTPVWHWTGAEGERPIYWNIYRADPESGGYSEWLPQEGLQQVDAVGSGCMLIARRVFEDPKMRVAPFRRTTEVGGQVEKGPDIAFCERARACGFEVWTHFDYPCRHFVEVELTEVIGAYDRG